MTGYSVSRYESSQAQAWDSFVQRSKNGTFLHERSFMDYHQDRFSDHSLIVRHDNKVVALLPANADGDALVSHGGLTYGGFVTDYRMRVDVMCDVVEATLAHARDAGFSTFRYKPLPHFYHRAPAEEDIYALFQAGARVMRIDAASAIRMAEPVAMSKSKKHGVKAARKAGVEVRQSSDWAICWGLIETVLAERHGTKPTHSLADIQLLVTRHPDRIKLFGAFLDRQMIAALVIFECRTTIHVQYIASSDTGRDIGGVDAIVDYLLNEHYKMASWFDFGISTEDQGRALNAGLSRQKEMFGARTVIYQQLELTL